MSIIGKYLSILIGYNTSKVYQSNVIFRKRKWINMASQTTRSELKAFCEDSTIYGLRYFVNSRRPWERIFWISFLILGIFLSVLIVRKSLVDWENDPLYTVIDTISYPVQNKPFPSVTVCPPGRDRWAFVEKVLNYVKFQCYNGYTYTDQDCIDSQIGRSEFRFLLEEIHKRALDASLSRLSVMNKTDIEELVLKYIGQSEKTKEWDPYDRFVEYSEKFLRQMLHYATSNNTLCSSLTSIEDRLVEFIINSLGKIQTDLQEYLINLEKSINESQCNTSMASNISSTILSECINNATCNEFIKLGIAYIELFDIYGSYKVWDIGSLIAYFSPTLADSEWTFTPKESVLNNHITELFRALTLSKSNLSAYDIVALLSFDEYGMKPMGYFPDFKKLLSVWEETNFVRKPEGWQVGCYIGNYDREWKAYMDNQSHLNIPCIGENNISISSGYQSNEPCCKLRQDFDERMYKIIRMMKYVQYPPHEVDQSETDPYNQTIQPDFISIMDIEYPLYNNTPKFFKSSKKEIANPLIPFCSFNSEWDTTPYQKPNKDIPDVVKHCSAFKPSLTDKGICYSWNNDKFSSLFTKSEYIEKLSGIFEYRTKVRPIVYPEANGPNYGFKFIIDAHTFSKEYKRYSNEMQDIDVVIHDKGDLPYFKLNGFKVRAGTETDIIVSSNALYSTEVVKSIDLKKRKCRFGDEPLENSEGTRFMSTYSQTGCTYQCYLEIAAKICGCTPWYFPRVPGTPSTMCDSFGNQCFYMTMNKNKNASLECSRCDYDCNRTQHTTSLVIRKIDAGKFCSERQNLDYPMTTINSYMSLVPNNHNHNPQLFYLNWKAHLEGKKYVFNQTAHCIWKVENDFAIVNLYLSTPTIPRMKQDVKHKLHDKLSLLGGILGLSCGINILSLFEVVFYLIRMIMIGFMNLVAGKRPTTLKDMKHDSNFT